MPLGTAPQTRRWSRANAAAAALGRLRRWHPERAEEIARADADVSASMIADAIEKVAEQRRCLLRQDHLVELFALLVAHSEAGAGERVA